MQNLAQNRVSYTWNLYTFVTTAKLDFSLYEPNGNSSLITLPTMQNLTLSLGILLIILGAASYLGTGTGWIG